MKAKCIVTLILSCALLASCSNTPVVETTLTEETTTVATETTTETSSSYPSDLEVKEESEILKKATFYRDGNPIESKIYLPEGEGPFKTVIIVGGLYTNLGYYFEKAKVFNDNGYAVVEMLPTINKLTGDERQEYMGDFVFEEVQDLLYVMDDLKCFPEIDLSNIYLFGHSVGGLTTLYGGMERQDSIKGITMFEPGFQFPDSEYADTFNFRNEETLRTDFYPFLSECKVPVLIVKGTGERPGVDFEHFYDKAAETIPSCEVISIKGADHSMKGKPGIQAAESICEHIKGW